MYLKNNSFYIMLWNFSNGKSMYPKNNIMMIWTNHGYCGNWKTTDWEAIADRAPDELLSSQCLPEVSELSLEDTKVQAPKRRGRGTFSYKRLELYSDQTSNGPIIHDSDETASHASKETTEIRHCKPIISFHCFNFSHLKSYCV